MNQRQEIGPLGSRETEPIRQGIGIRFSNPEVLRAFILDPKTLNKPSTLAERMSGIREVPLGEVPLGGDLFKSAKFTLVVEPDRRPRTEIGRSTAIIRTDITLGQADSNLKKLQLGRIRQKVTRKEPEDALDLPIPDENQDVYFVPWSRNTFRIVGKKRVYDKGSEKFPLVLLQVWDTDVGAGSVSISLLSNVEYSENWNDQNKFDEQARKLSVEIDPDNADRWIFFEPVGVSTYDPQRFRESLEFYERAFFLAMGYLYKSEGMEMSDTLHVIESPMILGDQKMIGFEDVGGQDKAVHYLRQFADLEKRGKTVYIPGMKRAILFAGPPGNGKSTLAEAFANDLGAPLLRKTTRDLIGVGGDIVRLVESSLLEAKAEASRTGCKAVLCFEQLEAFLGQNQIAHDYFLNTMDKWLHDSQVILIATSNSPNLLHEGITSRFEVLSILPPNEKGIKEILEIQVKKIAQALGSNVFADVDLDRLARRLTSAKDLSGRDIAQFLSNSYLLTRRGRLSELNTETLLQMIPDRRTGFKTS